MKSRTLGLLALGVLLAGVVFVARSVVQAADTTQPSAPTTQAAPAGDNSYANDFTKGLGKYKLDKADGKQVDGEGVKITNLNKNGGLMQEGNKNQAVNVSATPFVVVEVVNGGTDDLKLQVKVKSDADHTYTYSKIPAVAKGPGTIKVNLKDSAIDLTHLNYLRVLGNGECDLTIKSITFVEK